MLPCTKRGNLMLAGRSCCALYSLMHGCLYQMKRASDGRVSAIAII